MKKKDIGKLYGEQFQNFEAPVSSQEWLAVKAGLGKSKLLALHVTHFKVYYVAAAVVAGSSGVATGVYQYYTNSKSDTPKDPKQNEMIIQPAVKDEKTDSTIHFEEGVNNMHKKEKKEEVNNSEEKNNSQNILSVDTMNNSIDKSIPVGTEDNKNNKADTSSVIRSQTPPKRVIYVSKTDTIVVSDTLTEPPKKKRKK